MTAAQFPSETVPAARPLTAAEFHRLADVPPEVESFANLNNAHTRRVYENALRDFVGFPGIERPAEFHTVTRAYYRLARRAGAARAWRQHDQEQERRTILSALLFHTLRREELCKLKERDFRHARKGVPHLKVSGKGGKMRYVPLHPGTSRLIHDYLDAAGHGEDQASRCSGPCATTAPASLPRRSPRDGVYTLVRTYSAALGFEIGAHTPRATAATNALDHQAGIAKVQDWLGFAKIDTKRIYRHRRTRPEDSTTFKVAY
jgi:hypothetical protein